MVKFNLKPITAASWILHSGGNRLALVYQRHENEFACMGQLSRKTFASLAELEHYLGGTLVVEETAAADTSLSDEVGEIAGYPIKHDTVHDPQETPVPNYKKSANSDIRFAAGYYGVLFSNGWVAGFCPKLTTLSQYEYIGPFKTKLEMNHQISCQNKKISEDKLA